MQSDKRAARRRYSDEIKARVMAECDAPGASVAKVAMSHSVDLGHGGQRFLRDPGALPRVAHNIAKGCGRSWVERP
jgi:transposase